MAQTDTATTEDIEDAYAGTWMNHHNERGRQVFRDWLAAELAAARAEAWNEGYSTGFNAATYDDGQPDANPYRVSEIRRRGHW